MAASRLGIGQERIELEGEPAPVALVVGDEHGRAHADQGLGVARLVVAGGAGKRDQNRRDARHQQLGHRHGPGPDDADVGRVVEVGHLVLERHHPVAQARPSFPSRRDLRWNRTTGNVTGERLVVTPAGDVVQRAVGRRRPRPQPGPPRPG